MNKSNFEYDLLVIGGGINGAGIAADAAGRGLSVVLCEKGDLASATSSSSSKLIHGGLRYLEQYEFMLVRKALKERELLAGLARHIIRPIPFNIPQLPHSRNSLLIRAGLFLYDYLAPRKLFSNSRRIYFGDDSPLNLAIKKGYEYWDAQVDDARLVVLNALQAESQGARILCRTECTRLEATDKGWTASLRENHQGEDFQLGFKAVVNATGPWVSSVSESFSKDKAAHDLRLVKGSHIIVPRVHQGEQAFFLQHHDGRVVFIIPYQQEFSLIGTTEEEYEGDLDKVEISQAEKDYLLGISNLYLRNRISESDIVHSYAGVRPLIDEQEKDASKVSRDFSLEMQEEPHPILSIYGGKVTSYRLLAEHAVNKLQKFFPDMQEAWTAEAMLPGGDFDMPESLYTELVSRHGWLGADIINRWINSYGTLSFDIVEGVASKEDLGICFGHTLYQKEVDYLCNKEWARDADDILWRRSKLGLILSEDEKSSLRKYLEKLYSSVK